MWLEDAFGYCNHWVPLWPTSGAAVDALKRMTLVARGVRVGICGVQQSMLLSSEGSCLLSEGSCLLHVGSHPSWNPQASSGQMGRDQMVRHWPHGSLDVCWCGMPLALTLWDGFIQSAYHQHIGEGCCPRCY